MKVAVSLTKILEVEDMDLASLKYQFERPDYEENGLDWYDIYEVEMVWSYAIIGD